MKAGRRENPSVAFFDRDQGRGLVVGAVEAGVELSLCLHFSDDVLQAQRDHDRTLTGVHFIARRFRNGQDLAVADVDHIPLERHVAVGTAVLFRELCRGGGAAGAQDLEAVLLAADLVRVEEKRLAATLVGGRCRRRGWILLRRVLLRGIRFGRVILWRIIVGRGRRLFTNHLIHATTLEVTVVAARRVGLTLQRRTATAGILCVVATHLGLVRIGTRRPGIPGALRIAGTGFRSVSALSAGLGFLIAGTTQTFVDAGTIRLPREVRAAPFLDAALSARGALFRIETLAARTHWTVVSGRTGNRALHDFARL